MERACFPDLVPWTSVVGHEEDLGVGEHEKLVMFFPALYKLLRLSKLTKSWIYLLHEEKYETENETCPQ